MENHMQKNMETKMDYSVLVSIYTPKLGRTKLSRYVAKHAQVGMPKNSAVYRSIGDHEGSQVTAWATWQFPRKG